MEGLREGCFSCRASGPAARAMVMARCFPASCTVSQKARARVEGRCSWLPGKLGQEERGEGRKAATGLHGCWPRTPSRGPFQRVTPVGAAPLLGLESVHEKQTVVLVEVGPRGPLVQAEAVTWAYGHSQVCP